MLKKDKIYYENLYLAHLYNLNSSSKKEDFEEAKRRIEEFKNDGLSTNLENEVLSDNFDLNQEEYFSVKDRENYKKFIENNQENIDSLLAGQVSADEEINRIKGKKTYRTFGKVIVAGLLVAAVAMGINSCNKKKKDNSIPTTTTSYTTLGTTEETSTLSTFDETTSTSDYGFSDFDDSNAIPSMSDAMNGIVINDPTTGTQSNNNNGNGGSNNTNGTTVGTTEPTTTNGTTGTTPTNTPTNTPTSTPTSTPTTAPTSTQPTINDSGDTVPTTSYIEPSNTAPADDRNQRDVVIDDYDGVQPSYIDEDPTQTYPTYINTNSTTTTTTTTVAPTTAPTSTPTTAPTSTTTQGTVNNMPVEEDPNETYETFFEIPNKESTKKDDVKRLTLIRK